jgi:hypothetical protein
VIGLKFLGGWVKKERRTSNGKDMPSTSFGKAINIRSVNTFGEGVLSVVRDARFAEHREQRSIPCQ